MDYKTYDIVVKGKESVDIKPLEPGYYPAVCYGVVVTGTHYDMFRNGSKTEAIIFWELPTETFMVDGTEVRKTITETYTFSLTNSNLAKMLEGWRGRPFTDEELAGFSLNKIIGVPCGLTIINKTSKTSGKTFPKVQAVTTPAKGMMYAKDMSHEPLWFNICDDRFDLALIDDLPNWVADKVRASDEYSAKSYANKKVDEKFSDEELEIHSNEEDLPF